MSKVTKKMRKKEKGMNAATRRDFNAGYKKPSFLDSGTTYVNPNNFNLL